MDDLEQISQDLEAIFERLDAQIDDCRRAQAVHFEQLAADPHYLVEQRTEKVSKDLNDERTKLLDRIKVCLRKLSQVKLSLVDFSDLDDLSDHPINSDDYHQQKMRNSFIQQIGQLVTLTEPRASPDSIKHNLLTDLVHKNQFDIDKKIEYLHLFNPKSHLDVGNLTKPPLQAPNDAIVMLISRDKAFHYKLHQDKLRIVRLNRTRGDKQVRVLLERECLPNRAYMNFKIYGYRIIATGLFGKRHKSDVFIDIYDFSLKLRASKKFGSTNLAVHPSPIFKIERVSPDIFMHRYTARGEVYTLFDFNLNTILEHQTPRQTFYPGTPPALCTKFEPFFYDGQSVQKLTARHLYLLAHSSDEQVECKKRMMRIYLSQQDVKWEHLQEANQIDKGYFDYEQPPAQFLLFNLDRDSVNYFQLMNDRNVRGEFDRFNWIMVDERHRGGLTPNKDLYFLGDNSTMLIL